MTEKKAYIMGIGALCIMVLTAAGAQYTGYTFAHRYLTIGTYFYTLWIILRVVIPILMLMALRVPLEEIGLAKPEIDPSFRKALLVASGILVVVFIGLYFYQDYMHYYGSRFGDRTGEILFNFSVFTLSTLTAWEFMHRGFLLMGITYVVKTRLDIKPEHAYIPALIIVWIFEVGYHFIKPGVEVVGMAIGSPLLSYCALRTKSIITAFAMHLLVEFLFILTVALQGVHLNACL